MGSCVVRLCRAVRTEPGLAEDCSTGSGLDVSHLINSHTLQRLYQGTKEHCMMRLLCELHPLAMSHCLRLSATASIKPVQKPHTSFQGARSCPLDTPHTNILCGQSRLDPHHSRPHHSWIITASTRRCRSSHPCPLKQTFVSPFLELIPLYQHTELSVLDTQAVLLWLLVTPALYQFRRYCVARFALRPAEDTLDLVAADAAPKAHVAAAVFLPPALRPGSCGWYPESGKVWEKFGLPKYVWPF